jgi:hypothetical protein
MMRAASVSVEAMDGLKEELAFAETQLQRMQRDPAYQAIPDPRTIDPEHTVCEREAEELRTQNLQLRVLRERLWAKASHLEHELRKYKPTRYPVSTVKRGRPRVGESRQQAGVRDMAAEIESLTGVAVTASKNPYQLVLNRPQLEAIVRSLRVAEECAAIHLSLSTGLTQQ